MQFGRQTEIITTDDNGSTVSKEATYVRGEVVNRVRVRVEEKVRVHSKKEELTEYLQFSDSLTSDRLDACFRIERSSTGTREGWYYVVKCYTYLQ